MLRSRIPADLKDERRVVIVTGASSGIGYVTALRFAQKQYHVLGTARRRDRLDELEKQVAALAAPHGIFAGIVGDIREPKTMLQVVQVAVERWGRVDVLVANAGLGHRGSLIDAEWADLEAVMRTNMDGVLHSVRAVVPVMRSAGSGHVIVVSSVSYSMTMPYAAIYAASKAFASSISRSLRLELESTGIHVTDMLVGRTVSEFNEKRLGQPGRSGGGIPVMPTDQVADAIVRVVGKKKRSVTLRWIDRLLLMGNWLIPDVLGRLARRQYKSK